MDMADAMELLQQLIDPQRRGSALVELSKKRELFQDLAPMLWYSFGAIAALLQEIVFIYPALSPPTLSPGASNRVCNALALLQCVASHPETRYLFISAQMPSYLFPFLITSCKERPFEYLRLTSLGVIGSLMKIDDPAVVSFLLSTEIIPLCLHAMEIGGELSRTVATFIIEKIILDDIGLGNICSSVEKFFSVYRVLVNMIESPVEPPSCQLLKHIIRCFLRLTDHPRACLALKACLPLTIADAVLNICMDDPITNQWLQQLFYNVTTGAREILVKPRGFGPRIRIIQPSLLHQIPDSI